MCLKFIQLDSFYEQMLKIQDLLEKISSLFKTLAIFNADQLRLAGH